MAKDRPLTALQMTALLDAEDTLFGDTKMSDGFGRSVSGLRKRGLVEGDNPHIYLTCAGRRAADALREAVATGSAQGGADALHSCSNSTQDQFDHV